MKYVYRMNPDLRQELRLQGFPNGGFKICLGETYDLDTVWGGDARQSSEVSNALQLNWIQRIPVDDPVDTSKNVVVAKSKPKSKPKPEPEPKSKPKLDSCEKVEETKEPESKDAKSLIGDETNESDSVCTMNTVDANILFDTAIGLGVIKKVGKNKRYVMQSISGKSTIRFKNRERGIARIKSEPELVAHIQKLCAED